MKRRTLALLLGVVMAFGLTACGGDSAPSEETTADTKEPLNLEGVWGVEPAEDGTTIQAIISGETIEVNWVASGENWLYWSGSYEAPTESSDTYSWTSQADGKAKNSLLGSSEDTKEFTYKNGILSCEVTLYEGESSETGTLELKRVEAEAEEEESKNNAEFEIGETWTVDGLWSITVDGVTAVDDRNQFDERNPAAVYLVDYTYTNIGFEDETGYWDGLYISLDNSIVDNANMMGYSYPGDVNRYPQETPVGATCKAQVCIGVDNAGSFKLNYSMYTNDGVQHKATFLVGVE